MPKKNQDPEEVVVEDEVDVPFSPFIAEAGASGVPLTEDEETAEMLPTEPPKKKTKRSDAKDRMVETLERRLAEVEGKLDAHKITTKTCHMCHKSGARVQRGNTGEWFHEPCLADYRVGMDPIART